MGVGGGTGVSYCTTSGATNYEFIEKVVIGTINNTSGDDGGYGNYTTFITNLAAGSSVQIKLTPGFHGDVSTEYWTVFIDYNQNGVFTDAGEKVTTGYGTSRVSRTFTVPTTAKSGGARMRIIMQSDSKRNATCGTYGFGEVEDYYVNVTGGTLTSYATTNRAKANNLNSITIAPNPVKGSLANPPVRRRMFFAITSARRGMLVVWRSF